MSPITSINGVAIKCPSTYVCSLNDVSSSDAGRTDDGTMHKMKIGTCYKLELGWNGLKTSEISAILSAVQSEYMSVTFLSPLTGTYLTRTFYRGDTQSPMYSSLRGLWENLTFDLIERSPE